MEIEPPPAGRSSQTVSALLAEQRKGNRSIFLALSIAALCLVPVLVVGGIVFGFALVVALVILLILVVCVVRWPLFGFFVALGCTLLIEQEPLPFLSSVSSFYVFYWPEQLQGLPDRPIGFFLLFVLLAFTLQRLLTRRQTLQGGALLIPYLLFFLCVVWGIVHGLSTGGNLQIVTEEVRSFWYLFLGYIAAYNMITTKKRLHLLFWFIIICAGIKALEGVYIFVFIAHGDLSANHQIMSHEESYFWVAIILLIMLFSLHYKYRPQFFVALSILPFLVVSLIANNRRADYVALLAGMGVAWCFIFLVKPEARRLLVVLLVTTLLVTSAYVAVFYNQSSGIGEPARAIVSVFYTNPQDAGDVDNASSNAYRVIEDFDLEYTVKENPMGLGFGKPFLQPLLLPNISASDPVYNLIPHNTIYWVWMRLGPIGYLALWYLFGAMIVRGCVYVRRLQDKYLQLVAIYIVCMVIMEILVAYADYQLSFYRNVLYVGMLAGVLMRLPVLDLDKEEATHEIAHAHTRISVPHMGSRPEELSFS